jgi:hypothetical protein
MGREGTSSSFFMKNLKLFLDLYSYFPHFMVVIEYN